MLTRFARFNIVGVLGFGLQVGVLTLLVRAGAPLIVATVVAVEAAVLHNFAWHEHWTWRAPAHERAAQPERVAQRFSGTWIDRLGRFHVTNGLISLAGNTILTPLIVSSGVRIAIANLAAVLACSVVNFALAHVLVFAVRGSRTADQAQLATSAAG